MKYNITDTKLIKEIADHYEAIIRLIGEDPTREGLLKTPERAAKALLENTRGYKEDAAQKINAAVFQEPGSELVIVRDIEFYSLCEHHILPFYGTITIGYMPDDAIVGLSKLGRIVDTYSRRLQIQERLTRQLCETVAQTLSPRGVIVVAQADHLCMKMRGIEKQSSKTVTIEYCGEFEDINRRREFFELLQLQQ